jgi:hypothetical protein
MPAESSLRFVHGSFRLPGFGPDAKDAIPRIISFVISRLGVDGLMA